MTLHQHVLAARDRLVAAGLPESPAALDAEVLARLALGWDRAEYLVRRHEAAPLGFDVGYEALVFRRLKREPVAQIAGRREFWTREFEVNRDVLTPRPETELIVEEALAWHQWRAGVPDREIASGASVGNPRHLPHAHLVRVVDVGTGSGCLAVTLALELPDAQVVATDVSAPALAVARRNAALFGAANRVRFVRTSLLEGIACSFDLIVANPPYVPDGHARALSAEVREYEPAEALFGGHDGLDLIRSLLEQAQARIAPAGLLLIEFGAGQDDSVQALVSGCDTLVLHAIRADVQGIPRLAVIGRREHAERSPSFVDR